VFANLIFQRLIAHLPDKTVSYIMQSTLVTHFALAQQAASKKHDLAGRRVIPAILGKKSFINVLLLIKQL
jgi:hypothetical protein